MKVKHCTWIDTDAFKRSLNTGHKKEERYIQDIFIVDVKDKLGH